RSTHRGPGLVSQRAGLQTGSARAALGQTDLLIAGAPPGDPLLQPYFPSRHGPRHNHRYVRDCQPLKYGNVTHETWPSDNRTGGPVATTRTFVSYIPPEGKDHKVVYGHFTFVRNPLRTFSVLEPGGVGGCQAQRRAPVEETAKLGKCLVAQNGGYFDMGTGECLGNVVSDGKLVKNSGGLQNAQFGIRKDGTMVFGYLSEEDVLDQANPFVQLVSGVVWLLRDGEVYVSQSQMAECGEIQTTGTFDKFINVISARTAVGHDRQGQLVLVHVDGQTESRGVNLWEMAEFLKHQGIVNAINLDGGGSATLVLNGTLASYPSEHCSFDNMWRCPRSISTIMCIHEPACEPADCSGHGNCVEGECHCTEDFWRGPACDILDCGPSNCSLHALTMTDFFVINSLECPMGWYGPNCQKRCACEHMCPCDRETGNCNVTYELAMELFTPPPGKTWIFMTSVLALLLVISTMGNVGLFLKARSERRHESGNYLYHPLREMNGKASHTSTSAACETEDTQDQSQALL
uniref:N-acetylglucosamine-1-phosphodiester alpha-N-acetylglucosaminidase n=1 Tax=Aquila chrysaetos chrysaetos TaxID=223781 RepID=A0A663EYZ2_AQUCH